VTAEVTVLAVPVNVAVEVALVVTVLAVTVLGGEGWQ
jgi:hypothetical protein